MRSDDPAQRRRVTSITVLAIVPILVLGYAGWTAMRSASSARRAQLRTSAVFAGELARAHIARELLDYFQPRQQKLMLARREGEVAFQKSLHWVYVSAELMDAPQFLSDSELRAVPLAEDPTAPGGHAAAHAGGETEPGRNAVLLVLREHMARRARELMGFDPGTAHYASASVAALGEAEDLAGPRFAWLRIDLRDAAGATCTVCEPYVRQVGAPAGPGHYTLLAVTFPLLRTPEDEPGLFGAVVPLTELKARIVLPVIARPAAVAGVAALAQEEPAATDTAGARAPGRRSVAEPAPRMLARAGLGTELRLIEAGVQAAHPPGAPHGDDVLYEVPVLGDGAPWRIEVIRTTAAGAAGWDGRLGAWPLLLVLLVALLVWVVIQLGRSNLQQLELAQLRSHLVSNISHELKTPLSLIRLYTETLEQGRVGSETERQQFLEIISNEAKRLTHLINNILDFDRIEAGHKRYSYAQVSPAKAVRATADAYRYQLTEQGFELRVDIAEGLPLLMLDEEALAQALINLLDNAAKYSDTVKEIGVKLARNGDHVCLSVTDRGIGIPQREQRKIFESFYRVEHGLVHDVKGSGLGLAVVRHVAESHGGWVSVESVPGRGSTFTVWLPVGFEPEAG
jgi:signal transduction histidine kinase